MCVGVAREHTHTLSLLLSGSVHYFGLDPSVVTGALAAFVIAHGFAQDILGKTLDYTLKPATMLQTMLNIPNNTTKKDTVADAPKPKPKPRAPRAPKTAKDPEKASAKAAAKPKATPAPAPSPAPTTTVTRSRRKKD